MSGPTLVVFVGGLAAIFLLIVATLVWQEARSRTYDEGVVYVIDDAIGFIGERLPADVSDRVRRSDIQRILEWEIFYLQGLAQKRRSQPVETIAGGDGAAVSYITGQIAEKHGVTYDAGDVAAVLRLEAEYLVSIGAVGNMVEGEETQR